MELRLTCFGIDPSWVFDACISLTEIAMQDGVKPWTMHHAANSDSSKIKSISTLSGKSQGTPQQPSAVVVYLADKDFQDSIMFLMMSCTSRLKSSSIYGRVRKSEKCETP